MKNLEISKVQVKLYTLQARLTVLTELFSTMTDMEEFLKEGITLQLEDAQEIIQETDEFLHSLRTPIDAQKLIEINQRILYGNRRKDGHSDEKMSLSEVA